MFNRNQLKTTILDTNKAKTNLYVDKNASKDFAKNIEKKYNELQEKYNISTVKNIFILSDAQTSMIKDVETLGKKEKNLLVEYIENDAKNAFGFYSKTAKSFVFIEDNHERKNKKLEGSVAEQAEDTLTHEFGHLFGNEKSSETDFKDAYLTDLKTIAQKIEDNEVIKTDTIEMTYKEAVEYFKHYIAGVNFEDGINEQDITETGLQENYAEGFSILHDEHNNPSNKVFETLFFNSMKEIRKDITQ